jgi:hypothetical protein
VQDFEGWTILSKQNAMFIYNYFETISEVRFGSFECFVVPLCTVFTFYETFHSVRYWTLQNTIFVIRGGYRTNFDAVKIVAVKHGAIVLTNCKCYKGLRPEISSRNIKNSACASNKAH